MNAEKTKQFIQEAFTEVIENVQATEETYAKYFSKDYMQYVDGKTLNYNDFVNHMNMQKQIVEKIKITVRHMIVEGDKVSSVHIAEAVKKDGGIVKIQVNAMMGLKDGKIVLCDELTHLLEGTKSDRDIGSCH